AEELTPESLAATLRLAQRDDAERDRVRAAGPARAREFSWRRTAEITRDVWRSLLPPGDRAPGRASPGDGPAALC
ncbi:MAG: hypothetical protein KC591_08035, partial [Gemmatimonadetes bacterium]|nr:hypothetical protein [Gemmatimonadota bacterium]